MNDIARAIDEAIADDRPSLVACKTIIGKGAPTKQGTSAAHGAPLGREEMAAARESFGWTAEPFVIPDAIEADWRQAGARGNAAHKAWRARLDASDRRAAFETRMAPLSPQRIDDAIRDYIRDLAGDAAEGRDAQGIRNGAGPADRKPAATDRRVRRSDRVQQHQNARDRAVSGRQLRRALRLLRHPRIRHGGGDERDGAAWRRDPLWRHVPDLQRLCPQRHPVERIAAGARGLCDDA